MSVFHAESTASFWACVKSSSMVSAEEVVPEADHAVTHEAQPCDGDAKVAEGGEYGHVVAVHGIGGDIRWPVSQA